MEPSGNLVIYSGSGVPVWHTGTSSSPDNYLKLSNGGAILYRKDGSTILNLKGFVSPPIASPAPAPSPAGSDVLGSGKNLGIGASIQSQNGRYVLKYQSDGNLVLYGGSSPVWSSGTNGPGGAGFVGMLTTGDLIIFDSFYRPIWSSNTNENSGAYLRVEDTGQIKIYSSGGSEKWTSSQSTATASAPTGVLDISGSSILSSGETMGVENPILSPDGWYSLRFQSDGNLVLYNKGNPVGDSKTYNSGIGGRVIMQPDGNLVLYSSSGTPLWNSKTFGNPGAYLRIDGGAAIYSNSGVVIKRLGF
ncbi:MAG: hypothetical protein A2568_02690 [Candidatus Yanofskybacteria bacterium RIFOXYD1_FULL_44_17]|nr:MAG: hypothetical protein A2207_00090 [Candidatus Yanofskybacteria bacterium RIFOXYA1_FULL_44_17]OGN36531.1 MAG: hypothetical protein A2241_02215 [Candidatus Yanofskybacteria bacterium RIFOXYA2_FULL_45_28]OGN37126.1 MAG: hypothetical protein A2405_03495 [Candidatus Yanofskybacteria bacterium RIFOXYC1_FULL_44_16]OGN37668.1 MAG: hypothetical protein A2371_00960 [Candidatus Yanofskybacteria bacterium RIFOXYB1_FULL_44_29]OGN37794.1 MAG: hypothetical protein A2302_02265 [Candidatus Yanofskybacter